MRDQYPIIQTHALGDFQIAVGDAFSVLSEKERGRAAQFIRESDRESFIYSRYLLRTKLAEVLGQSASEVSFAEDEHGKPYLCDFPQVHFNLSHSAGYVMIGISRDGPIGVDIQQIESKHNHLAIAKRFFTEIEYLYIEAGGDFEKILRFYQVWVLKEAYVKGIGRGLAYGLDKFSVVGADFTFVNQINNWQLQLLDSQPERYQAGICTVLRDYNSNDLCRSCYR